MKRILMITLLASLLLLITGCATPYVVGIAKTNKYISGVYDVTDTTIYGVGAVGGPFGCGVVGYNRTIVRVITTGEVYNTLLRIKEQSLMEDK